MVSSPKVDELVSRWRVDCQSAKLMCNIIDVFSSARYNWQVLRSHWLMKRDH